MKDPASRAGNVGRALRVIRASRRGTGQDRSLPTSARSLEKIGNHADPTRQATIDRTTTNASPFHSLKSPVSSPPKNPISSSTRRRKTISRGKAQGELHLDSIGYNHHHRRRPADLPILLCFTTGLEERRDSGKGIGSAAKAKAKFFGGMFSGRNSGSYERLEGGHGPGRPSVGRTFAWKRFAIAAVALITLVYLFGPRGTPTVLGGTKPPRASAPPPFDVFVH